MRRAILLTLLLGHVATAATYYCDLAKTTAGVGTSANPWQWSQATNASLVAAGSMVYCRGTLASFASLTAANARGTSTAAITYKDWVGQNAPTVPGLTVTGPADFYLVFDGFTVTVPNDGIPRRGVQFSTCHHVTFKNGTINGSWHDPMDTGMTWYGVYCTNTSSNNWGSIVVEDCFIQNAYFGVGLDGTCNEPVVIRRCEIYHTSGPGVTWDTADDGAQATIEGCRISNQEVAYLTAGGGTTHGSGIALWNDNAIVRGNVIHDCGNTAGLRTYPDLPVPTGGFSNLTIENNLIYDTINSVPVQLNKLGTNIVVRNNTFIAKYKYYPDTPYKAQKYDYALALKWETGQDGSGFLMHNNIIGGQLDSARNAMTEDYNFLWSWWAGTDFPQTGLGANTEIVAYAPGLAQAGSYNSPYTGDVFASGFFLGSSSFTLYHAQYINNVHHGHDLTAAYQLASGSYARNAGSVTYATATDLLGAMRDTQPDIGAYEYVAAVTRHEWYVDAAASEGGDGSPATPWDDLSDISGYDAGDIIYLKRGSTWREGLTISTAGTPTAYVTVKPYGTGNNPVLKGTNLVTGWTGGGGGGGNNFGNDADCRALWRFENGALGTDSKSTNTLTVTGAVANTTTYKEGAASADFEDTTPQDYMNITDASLSSGFPLKNGDTNKKISVTSWYRPESLPAASNWDFIYSKLDYNAGQRSFALGVYNNAGTYTFSIAIGYSSGGSYERKDLTTVTPTTGQWYHVAATFQDSDKTYRIRVWDDTAQTVYDVASTTTNNIYVGTSEVAVGKAGTSYYLDGLVDELVVFSDILTTTEIDQIRQGTYGTSTLWQATLTTEPRQVFFDGTRGKRETSEANVNAQYEWYWTANLLKTYAASDPDTLYTAPGVEACVRPSNLADGLLRATAGYVRFENIEVAQSNVRGIEVEAAPGVVISGCKVTDSNDGGIVAPSTATATVNLTIEDCEVTRNNGGYADAVSDSHHEAIAVEGTNGFTIRRNKVYDNYAEGIDAKYGATNGDIYQNVCYGNGNPTTQANIVQIYLDGATYVDVYQNRIYGGTAAPDKDAVHGILLGIENASYATANVNIWGNVIVDCLEGVRFWNNQTTNFANIHIINNTFGSCDNAAVSFTSSVEGDITAPLYIKNNILWMESSNNAILDSTTGNSILALATIANNGFAFNKASETLGTNYVVTASPQFADAAAGNWSLESFTSPFVGTGTDAGAPYYDCLASVSSWPGAVITADQRSYGSAWEIGAYVWTGGGTPSQVTVFYPGTEYQIAVYWYYNSSGSTGKFVCPNDVWIADPAGITITGVVPAPSDPCNIHAAIDPEVGYAIAQGLSSKASNYYPALDILYLLDPADPATHITVPAGHSVVFLMEYNAEQDLTWAKAAAVLTVLATAPVSNSFRPPWTGTDKAVTYNLSGIDYSVLPDVTDPGAGPSFAICEAWFAKPVLEWALEPGDYEQASPRQNLPRDGPTLAARTNVAALKLCCNYTDAEKQKLAAYLIQYGIDIGGILTASSAGSRGWLKHATANLDNWYGGRLVPAVLAARALNHTPLKTMLAKTGDYLWPTPPADAWYFGETVQTRLLTAGDVGVQTNWLNCPNFARNGQRSVWAGPAYPDLYESGAESFVSTAMCLYFLGANTLGSFNGLFDYADWRWTLDSGQFTQSLYPNWQEAFYSSHRDDYLAVRRHLTLMAAAAGIDQTIPYANRLAIALDGSASRNWHPNQAAGTTYAWTEGATPIATGATPTIALAPGTHTLTLTVTDVGSADYATDTVTISVLSGSSESPGWLMIRGS